MAELKPYTTTSNEDYHDIDLRGSNETTQMKKEEKIGDKTEADNNTSGERNKIELEGEIQQGSHTEEYNWSKFKPSGLCKCLHIVTQLVLIASVGSFLFGFNIALLNTALSAVLSEFLLCGPLPHSVHVAYTQPDPLAFCNLNNECRLQCGVFNANNELVDIKCPGGYSDISCPQSKWYRGFIQSAVLIGGAIGSISGGRMISHGRRFMLIVDMILFLIGVICSVCSNSFSSLFWARLIVGYSVGLASIASPTYMSEVTPPSLRGKYGVTHQVFVTVGILVGVLLGIPLTNPAEQSLMWSPPLLQRFWWRFMLGLGIIPVLCGLYFFLFVYTFETPLWYIEKGRYKDAFNVLRLINKGDESIARKEFETTFKNCEIAMEYRKKGLSFFNALSVPEYRWVIFVGLGLSGFQQFGGINVFVTSSSDLFARAGLNGTMQTIMTILMSLINVIMTFPTILLIERVGRKTLLFYGSLLHFLSVVPAAVSYWTEYNPEEPGKVTQVLAIAAVLLAVTFFALAFGPIVWVYLFEIYPIELKDTATSVATAFNWIAAIIIVFAAIVIPNRISFTLFSVLQLLGTLFVAFFIKETKGRSLGDSPYITSHTENNNV